MKKIFTLATISIGLVGFVHSAEFGECYDYNKILDRNRNIQPTINTKDGVGKWDIEGRIIECAVDETNKVSMLSINGKIFNRHDIVKISGQNAGKPEYSESEDQKFAKNAMNIISASLKDPESVRWQNVFLADSRLQTLCGEVNAKNSYGGYTGFKRFYYSSKELNAIEDQGTYGEKDLFLPMFMKVCSKTRLIIQ